MTETGAVKETAEEEKGTEIGPGGVVHETERNQLLSPNERLKARRLRAKAKKRKKLNKGESGLQKS